MTTHQFKRMLFSLFVCLLGFIGVVTVMPPDDSLEQIQEEYCSMVQLYMNTQGKAGWPAYKGTAHCSN